MAAGTLNSRVSIQQRTGGADALGQPGDSWTELAEVWAEIRHPSGVQQVKAGAEVSTVRASIKVRTRGDVTAAMRVVRGSKVYDIKAVLPDEQGREFMFLVCEIVA
jgi:SPP1 family predicted phage head-tail adaptor